MVTCEQVAAAAFTVHAPPRVIGGHALVEAPKPEAMTWPATFSRNDAEAVCAAFGGRLAAPGPAVEALIRSYLPFIYSARGISAEEGTPVSEGQSETPMIGEYLVAGKFGAAPPCPLVPFKGTNEIMKSRRAAEARGPRSC